MINLEKAIIGAVAGAGASVALSQIAIFAGSDKIVAGSAAGDPMHWFMVAAISGACAGGGLTMLLAKGD